MTHDVLQVAFSQIGVHEVGANNHGPQVEAYLEAVGLGAGNPWCAAYVAWCMRQAHVECWPMTGDTWALQAWAREHHCLETEPQKGDVFLLLGADGHPMHTGFVGAANGDYVQTVEGNTGLMSDTDGDGVAQKSRYWRGSMQFIRWSRVLRPSHIIVRLGLADVKCAAQLQGDAVRCDLRPLAEALGFSVDASRLAADNMITLRRRA
jgi:hypothetical protein